MIIVKEDYNKLNDIINNKFKTINKSPYSKSFYNRKKIEWNYKPENSLRISSHWNFLSGEGMHCVTNDKISDDTLAVGKYKNGKYDIIFQARKTDEDLNDDKEYEVLMFNFGDLINVKMKGKSVKLIEHNPDREIVAITH